MTPNIEYGFMWIQLRCDQVYKKVRYLCERKCNDSSEAFFNYGYKEGMTQIPNSENKHFFCREGWFLPSSRYTCYRVFSHNLNETQYYKTCKYQNSELATTLPDVIAHYNKCRSADKALGMDCPRGERASKIKKCFIHVMLSHWTHGSYSGKVSIYSGNGDVLIQNGTVLSDQWFLWFAATLSDQRNHKVTHVACQTTPEKLFDLSLQGGWYKCNLTNNYIPRYYLCDGHGHCLYGDDEQTCNYHYHGSTVLGLSIIFQCPDRKIISVSLVGNGIPDCVYGADEINNIEEEISFTMTNTNVNDRCVHDRDLQTAGTSFCMFYECPFMFKCRHTYCIHFKYLCDGVHDCPNGEDENYEKCQYGLLCPEMFKCVYGNHCLHPNKLCNGIKDCIDDSFLGEDESLCGINICPPKCSCFGHAYDCYNGQYTYIPVADKNAVAILFSGNRLIVTSRIWLNFLNLLRLDISYNYISKLQPFTFSVLTKLEALNLKGNRLSASDFVFFGLRNLVYLNLEKNNLDRLNKHNFWGINHVKILLLGYQKISHIDKCTFFGLHSLVVLNLVSNNIDSIKQNIFCTETFKRTVNLTGNGLKDLRYDSLQNLRQLSHTFFSSSKYCCFHNSPLRCGYIAQDQFMCRTIIDNPFLRFMTWLTGLWVFISNLFVLVWRFRRNARNASSLIIQNLAIADGTMGAYLLLLGFADQDLGKNYVLEIDKWLGRQLCRVAGALCSFSLETSLYFMMTMTIHFFLIIKKENPKFHDKLGGVAVVIFVGWVLNTTIIAFLFGYATIVDPTCIFFRLTKKGKEGWELTIGLMLVVNFLAYSVIAHILYDILNAIHRKRVAAKRGITTEEISLISRQAVITGNCFFSWLVMAAICVKAMTSGNLDERISSWVLVFVAPLNACCNPVLYTIGSLSFKKELMKTLGKKQASTKVSTTNLS